MSKLAEYRQLERHLADQQAALEAMKGDKGLEKEIEFEGKLRELLGEYSKSLRDVISILDTQPVGKNAKNAKSPLPEKGVRKARAMKVYKHPHTGEIVETKGGNHKLLKSWKSEHGASEVESWLQQ